MQNHHHFSKIKHHKIKNQKPIKMVPLNLNFPRFYKWVSFYSIATTNLSIHNTNFQENINSKVNIFFQPIHYVPFNNQYPKHPPPTHTFYVLNQTQTNQKTHQKTKKDSTFGSKFSKISAQNEQIQLDQYPK